MSESTPARQREMMFCHECHDEWYRDERGIICPECGSEFTEIIEDDNDPRDNDMFGHGHEHEDDDDSMPELEEADLQGLGFGHRPPRGADDDDPEEEDISQMRFQNTRLQNTGPGTYRLSATIHQSIPFPPTGFGQNGGNGPNTIGGIASFLSSLIGGVAQRQGQGQGQGQGQAEAGDGQGGSAPRSGPAGGPHVHHFTYSSGARLHPRDGDNPGPRLEPVDDLNNVLAGLFATFGQPMPGGPGHDHSGGPHEHDFGGMPHMNPLMGLFAAMSGGQHGDFVTSQEAMDRIISQLMEQTATSNAPGPASQADIESLPRKKITPEMLGDDGKADCSICMDEVAPEEEVTELPCKHWFHHQCVSAWLKEHDTCPHCRKGITKTDENAPKDTSSGANAHATSSSADPTASMPGAFGVTGEGTSNSPFVVPGSSPPPPAENEPGANAQGQPGANEGSSSEPRRSGWFS